MNFLKDMFDNICIREAELQRINKDDKEYKQKKEILDGLWLRYNSLALIIGVDYGVRHGGNTVGAI